MPQKTLRERLSFIRNGYLDVRSGKFYGGGRFHQLAEARALTHFIKRYEIDCIFDIGANAGQYGTALRRNVGFKGHIISVEPMPDTFRLLQSAASADPRWHAVNLALSDRQGTQEFNVMRANQFSSFLSPTATEYEGLTTLNEVMQVIPVPTTTFDLMFAEWKEHLGFKRPFLKLDTQGYEHVILQSGRNAARECVGIQAEVAFKRLYDGAFTFRQTFDLLDDMGFSLSLIFPNNAGHFPDCIEQDAVFHNRSLPPSA